VGDIASVAGVVKARRVRRIDGELTGTTDVDTSKISNRVIVLGIAETPRQHDARIAGIAPPFLFAHGVEPVDGNAPLLRCRMPRSLRRHLLRFQTRQHLAPAMAVLHYGSHRRESAQIHLRRGPLLAVTRDAIRLQERPDASGKLSLQLGARVRLAPQHAGNRRRRQE